MIEKYDKYNSMLRKCKCGGKVKIYGGEPWHQGFYIQCSRCGGNWHMDTYSPKEASEKWGISNNDCEFCLNNKAIEEILNPFVNKLTWWQKLKLKFDVNRKYVSSRNWRKR